MSHPTSTPTAPVLACAEVLVGALDGVVDADPMWLTLAEKESVLVSLQRSADRVNELLARVLAVAGDVAEEHGQRDAASWLAHQTRHDPARLRRLEKLGKALREDAPVLAGGVRAGVASVEQAQVITHALVDLPADLSPDIKSAAETVLTAECVNLAPRSLAIAGRRVLEVIDPDAADEHERRRLEAQDRRETCPGFVYRRRNGDGTSDLRIRIGDAAADRLMTYLEAYANPRASRLLAGARSTSATGGSPPVPEVRGAPAPSLEGPADDRRSYPERLVAALEAFLEHADPNRMPLHGGSATQIIVTIALADLISGLGHGLIDGDQPYPVGEIRRLACTAGIVPAVLGTNSEVSTSAEPPGCSTPRSAKPYGSTSPRVVPRAATSPAPGAKHTTPAHPGPKGATPTSPTESCSATSTTTEPTTTPTPSPAPPTHDSGSPDATEPSFVPVTCLGPAPPPPGWLALDVQ